MTSIICKLVLCAVLLNFILQCSYGMEQGWKRQAVATRVNVWSDWSVWSPCSVTCSDGVHYRARHCVNGTACIGNIIDQGVCMEPRCIHLIDGGWSGWSSWDQCSRTCGNGVELRKRQCDSPVPQDGGKSCIGSEDNFRFCHVTECPIDGGWGNYTDELCSVTCGDGVRVSVRHCDNPAPANGGKECQGSPTTFAPCNLPGCVIDGNWTEWSATSDCQVICGYGNQRRERYCTAPAPSNGGLDCPGKSVDTIECNNGMCPFDIKTYDHVKVKSAASQAINVQSYADNLCSDGIHSNAESLLLALCNATADSSLWRLGLKISEHCELIPLYAPVGYENKDTKEKKYGIMMACYNSTMEIAAQACDSGVEIHSINLVPNGNAYHMLLW